MSYYYREPVYYTTGHSRSGHSRSGSHSSGSHSGSRSGDTYYYYPSSSHRRSSVPTSTRPVVYVTDGRSRDYAEPRRHRSSSVYYVQPRHRHTEPVHYEHYDRGRYGHRHEDNRGRHYYSTNDTSTHDPGRRYGHEGGHHGGTVADRVKRLLGMKPYNHDRYRV
ncbi:hypothetical protein CPB86DRAFT_821577 [Serendipita vermifera]|nr:hypothetical protein CPB86DRAFT_821577 [Serendipita vermifera]